MKWKQIEELIVTLLVSESCLKIRLNVLTGENLGEKGGMPASLKAGVAVF